MMRKLALCAISALTIGTGAALAAGDEGHVDNIRFSFEGPFGRFDEHQLQRGLQVYTEVCAACHGLQYVPIRTLADEGGPRLPADQVRAYAAGFLVADQASNPHLLDRATGDYRPLEVTDNFPANHSVNAPDLSLMAKARAGFHGPYGTGLSQLFNGIGGPEYIYSLLTGYTGEEVVEVGTTFYLNHTFAGGRIAMAPPLVEDRVTYADGTPATVEQMAEDVTAFLMWAAEPKMMARKQAGFVAVLFIGLLAVLLYLTNKRLWAPIKGRKSA